MTNSRQRQRRGVFALLVAILLASISLVSTPAHADDSPFTDVSTSHRYFKEIQWMYDQGISTGWTLDDGTREYRPDEPVARDAMAAFFYRFRGEPAYTVPTTSPFNDVSTSQQFFKEMAWMKDAGISSGWSDGTFRPFNQTARDAMSAFMYRVAGEPAYTPPAVSPFDDVTTTQQFYKEMAWAFDTGVANNADDGTFEPLEPVTREMMAVFMYGLEHPVARELTVQSADLPAGLVGVNYTATLRASGGKQPFTWSATGLPAGLTIADDGVITGQPSATGNSTVQVKVTDANGKTASASLQLKVTQESPFSDVPLDHPYYKEIAWMNSAGISTGWSDGTFRPSEPVARDAMAAFFYRFQGEPAFTVPTTSPFNDVSTSQQFFKEMAWMKQSGISTGWSDGTFRPFNETARDAMSAFMYRAAGNPSYAPPAVSLFYDVATTQQFYKEMSWVYQKGVANNADDGTFDPFDSVTREMMAVFMYRLAHPSELTIQSTGLPGGVKDVAYETPLRASGGVLPFTWAATGLPAGLTISSQGVISGIPTAAGNSSVKLTVTDASGTSDTITLSLRVAADSGSALQITTTSVPIGVVNATYPGATFAAKNGVGQLSWSATGVPAGLTLSTDGKLTGTPSRVGQGTMTVQVRDGEGVRASSQINWVVNAALSISTNTLPMAVKDAYYDERIAAQGGVPGYQWSATGLPSGLIIDNDGDIWGYPTVEGWFDVTVTVKDQYGNTASKTLGLDVSGEADCDALKCIALTFDDGPLDFSDSLLNSFVNAGAKATFYDVGVNIKKDPDASRHKYEAGMEVGLHGWEHVHYCDFGYNYVKFDLDAAADMYEWAVGPWPNSWRPPYGHYNPTTVEAAGDVGLATIMWTENTFDYERTSANDVYWATMDVAGRDAIVLMHDGVTSSSRSENGLWQLTRPTADAMPSIIADLQDEGYTLVTVSAIIGGDPEPGEVYFDDNPVYCPF